MGDNDLEKRLNDRLARPQLRFMTCGSVDDGKSTLIGRLLHDVNAVFHDQMVALRRDSQRFGTTGQGEPDFALLLDGLALERQQGITIDVAWRYFSTPVRSFIVADTPGHVQYTRNMATAASNVEAAVLLVDARKGIVEQTSRHMGICALMGVKTVILAINKMDLIDWDKTRYDALAKEALNRATRFGIQAFYTLPIDARRGENLAMPPTSAPAGWVGGPTLLSLLETIPVDDENTTAPFRFPVQLVLRPDGDFRGFAGSIVSGQISRGQGVVISPAGTNAVIDRIVTQGKDLETARAGQAVVLTLDRPLDVARGDVIAGKTSPPQVADQFSARLVWMGEQPMLPGRSVLMRIGTTEISASVTSLRSRLNVETMEEQAARTLEMNDVGKVNLALHHPIAFDPYDENRDMGAFILVDRMTNETLAGGRIDHALRRSSNIHWQATRVDRGLREGLNGHRGVVVWFTGLSGSGKSTLADLLEQTLAGRGFHTMLLDGDNVRHGLNRDLGFTDEDRLENIRRFTEVAALMVEAGLITIVSVISPFVQERRAARERLKDDFIEVFVDAPLMVCEKRDPKGLYKKARKGLIPNFTGIGSPYEASQNPDVHIRTDVASPQDSLATLLAFLEEKGIFAPRQQGG